MEGVRYEQVVNRITHKVIIKPKTDESDVATIEKIERKFLKMEEQLEPDFIDK